MRARTDRRRRVGIPPAPRPEYEVVWAGRGAMPHQALDAEYWQQRQHVLTQGGRNGRSRQDLLTTTEIKRARLEPCDMAWRSTRTTVPGGGESK